MKSDYVFEKNILTVHCNEFKIDWIVNFILNDPYALQTTVFPR